MARPIQPLRQGGADGLCGIYALLNFIRFKKLERGIMDRGGGPDAFYWLLRAAEKQQLLDSDHIWGGFWWFELRAIFNHLATYFELPFRAVSLSDFSDSLCDPGLFQVVARAEEQGGALVTEINGGKHWILATGLRGGAINVHDSSHDEPIKWIERDKKKSFWR